MNKTIFLKIYLSKLFRFLGIVLTGQLMISFAFNRPYEKSDFLISFICGLLYMSSCREKTYKETVRLTKQYNNSIHENEEKSKKKEK